MTAQPCGTYHNGELCGRPKFGSSPLYCYWDRVARMSATDQRKAAEARLAVALGPARTTVPKKEWPAGERWCAGCQSYVPLWYCTRLATGGEQLSRCRACTKAGVSRSRDLSVYGVGPERKAAVLKKQRNACAACRKGQAIKELAMDHNHKTGAWRGILCQTCNHKVIGGAFESARILLACAYYLMNPPADEDSTWTPPEDLEFTLQVKRREPNPDAA